VILARRRSPPGRHPQTARKIRACGAIGLVLMRDRRRVHLDGTCLVDVHRGHHDAGDGYHHGDGGGDDRGDAGAGYCHRYGVGLIWGFLFSWEI
jgi:hypothetical protein